MQNSSCCCWGPYYWVVDREPYLHFTPYNICPSFNIREYLNTIQFNQTLKLGLWTPNLFGTIFFTTHSFETQIFWTQNLVCLKFWQNFWNESCFWKWIFWTKIVLGHKKIWTQNIYEPEIFFTQNFFGQKLLPSSVPEGKFNVAELSLALISLIISTPTPTHPTQDSRRGYLW